MIQHFPDLLGLPRGAMGAPTVHPLAMFGEGDLGGFWTAISLDLNDEDPVTAWEDESGEHTLEQAVAGRQPRLRIDGTTKWLEFDIEDMDEDDVLGDALLGEFAVSTAALTIIVAAQNEDVRALGSTGDDNDFNCRAVCIKVPQAAAAERDLNFTHNRPKFDGESGSNYGFAGMRHPENQSVNLTAAVNPALGTPGVASYVRNGTAIQDAWVDGEAVARNTTTTTTFTSTHLGIGYGPGTSLTHNTDGFSHWIGKIFAVFIIDRVLTNAERRGVEAYMRGLMP
jgi:hypothetical protein